MFCDSVTAAEIEASMKLGPWLWIAVGVAWLGAAIYIHETGYIIGLHFPRRINQQLALGLFYTFLGSVFLGWILPVGIGAMRFWRR